VAQIGLSAFADMLIPIAPFTLDLSASVAEQGTVANTRIVPVAGTVGDLTDTHTGVYTDAIDDQTYSIVSVTMGSEPIIGFSFTDTEANEIAAGVFSDTVTRTIQQHARAIANNVLDALFANIDTTYTDALSVAASAFDVDDVFDLRSYAVETGAWKISGDETLVLDAAYYNALLKDNAIQDKSASGLNATVSAAIPMVAGFKVIEAPSLTGGGANDTRGFLTKPGAVAIAMRGVATQANENIVQNSVVQDDETGVVLTLKEVFDTTYMRKIYYFQTLFGVGDGQTEALLRITDS